MVSKDAPSAWDRRRQLRAPPPNGDGLGSYGACRFAESVPPPPPYKGRRPPRHCSVTVFEGCGKWLYMASF